jgi:hypothetical protein
MQPDFGEWHIEKGRKPIAKSKSGECDLSGSIMPRFVAGRIAKIQSLLSVMKKN